MTGEMFLLGVEGDKYDQVPNQTVKPYWERDVQFIFLDLCNDTKDGVK